MSLGYAAEVLFQPDVFQRYDAAAIGSAMAGVFGEGLVGGAAMLGAVILVERRRTTHTGAYTMQMVGAVAMAAILGVVAWGLLALRGSIADALPYLSGEALRLGGLGVFAALVHGLGKRLQASRAQQQADALEAAALCAETELAALRLLETQIEPHFLFNTIATVRRTWRVDPSLGARMHDNTIRYLEASLPRMRALEASLCDEVVVTRAYLELFALRMGPRLTFTIDVAPSLAGLPFPRMALLTLVENAIKHGLMPSDKGGSITITARNDEAAVVVAVADDGVGFGAADTGGAGIGLKNIRARLRSQYGRDATLDLRAGAKGGVTAAIRIPHPAAAMAASTRVEATGSLCEATA